MYFDDMIQFLGGSSNSKSTLTLSIFGVDFVKVYNNVKEPELKVIIETAKERGWSRDIPWSMTMTHAIEMGITRLEHIRITGKEMLTPEEAEKIDHLVVGKTRANAVATV